MQASFGRITTAVTVLICVQILVDASPVSNRLRAAFAQPAARTSDESQSSSMDE